MSKILMSSLIEEAIIKFYPCQTETINKANFGREMIKWRSGTGKKKKTQKPFLSSREKKELQLNYISSF